MRYLLERLAERSTWIGLIAIATGAGVNLTPELTSGIITAGSVLAGTVAAITKG